jgi:branched-chain amino acid transport system permease protein
MTINQQPAPPVTDDRPRHAFEGEELGGPNVVRTGTTSPLQRFWSATSLGRSPGRSGSTLLRHVVAAGIIFFLLTAASANLDAYYNNQFAVLAATLCAALGLTVLIGFNGQLSLGHGAIMAIGAYTVTLIMKHYQDVSPTGDTTEGEFFLALGLAVLIAIAVGVIIGVAAARLRGPYLAGVTLGVALIVGSITAYWRDIFNGDQGLQFVPPPQPQLGPNFQMEQWQLWLAGGAVLVVFVLMANLSQSRIGRNFRAVRDDEIAAQLSGIHVARTQIIAFVVSSAVAGLSGGLLSFIYGGAQPSNYGLQLSLYLFLAIIVGGLGSLFGAVWGVALIVFVPLFIQAHVSDVFSNPDLQQRAAGNFPQLLFGALLVVIMILLPGGIQGLLFRVRRWSVSLFIRGGRR